MPLLPSDIVIGFQMLSKRLRGPCMEIDGQTGCYPLADLDAPVGAIEWFRKMTPVLAAQLTKDVTVKTPEGVMTARKGDYLVQHENGHAWPVKKPIFEGSHAVAGDSYVIEHGPRAGGMVQ